MSFQIGPESLKESLIDNINGITRVCTFSLNPCLASLNVEADVV